MKTSYARICLIWETSLFPEGSLRKQNPLSFIKKFLNLMVVYTVYHARRITFTLVNRVENQNEPKWQQIGGRLGLFWFSTRPTAMGDTDYNYTMH